MNVRRVAIIGAGPSSIAVAKHLLAEKHFTKIDIFEQRSRVGGVWDYLIPDKDGLEHYTPCPVPHTSSDDSGFQEPRSRQSNGRLSYFSPLYDRLEANLPKMLMQHSDLDFPDHNQLFPTHDDITLYLEQYATKDVRELIHFETQVVSAVPRKDDTTTQWDVSTRSFATDQTSKETYDAVVVGNGHYNVPFIPDMSNIAAWNKKYPGVISHSKFFKNPETFKNKRVLSIGIGPSGQDIATQISNFAPSTFVSTRSPTNPSFIPPKATHVPGIKSFLIGDQDPIRAVEFTDGSIESNLDAVIFCTGYLYDFPFLPRSVTSELLRTHGARVHNIYQHLLYTHDPSLALLALARSIVPFPHAEAQGAILARLWSGRLSLPSAQEMQAWERRREAECGSGKEFHKMAPPSDAHYINELSAWAGTAVPRVVEGVAVGKPTPYWGPKVLWMRMKNNEFREAFFGLSMERRREVRTLEELGFHYDEDGK